MRSAANKKQKKKNSEDTEVLDTDRPSGACWLNIFVHDDRIFQRREKNTRQISDLSKLSAVLVSRVFLFVSGWKIASQKLHSSQRPVKCATTLRRGRHRLSTSERQAFNPHRELTTSAPNVIDTTGTPNQVCTKKSPPQDHRDIDLPITCQLFFPSSLSRLSLTLGRLEPKNIPRGIKGSRKEYPNDKRN